MFTDCRFIRPSSLAILLSLLMITWLAAQDQESPPSLVHVSKTLSYRQPQKQKWEFGVEVEATGPVRGITVTVPVPIEWPEQKLKELPIEKSENVGRISFKNLGEGCRQMIVRIPSMRAGETARALFVVEVEKSLIVGPGDPSEFVFCKKVPKEVRQYLLPSPFIESRDRRIIKLAKSIDIDDTASAWDQVETIFRFVRDKLEYRFDTEIHSCLDALESGHGDCEELSSLFIAICRARGIPARAVWIPEHTYPEFYLEDKDGNGHWIPCQAAGQYEFGSMTEYRPILQKGDRFRVRGHRKSMRYVQPTLIAKDAKAPPTLKWVINQVKDKDKSGSESDK